MRTKLTRTTDCASLAAAKHETINTIVSEALVDNAVSDSEFKHVTKEMNCRQMKETLEVDKYRKNKEAL